MSHEQKGVVSLWIFREKENPADVDKDVLRDFTGVDSYDLDSQEGFVSDSETPILDLVGKLSYSKSFIAEALTAAKNKAIEKAYGVIAQYDFAYNPGIVTRPISNDPIFIGYFFWHE